jgi:CRISPR-associated protein Cas2
VNPKRLAKVAKYLEKKGIRIQYSFFSCEINKKEFADLKEELIELIDLKYDKLCFIPICDKCIKKIIYVGCDSDFLLPDFMVL